MCLLTVLDPGAMPDMSALEYGAMANPDGHGYAIITRRNNLIVRRGMDPDIMLMAFEHDRRHHLDGPAIFHSRIATGGVVDKSNCHPFYVGQDRRTVLAHNGILFQPHKGDHRSDTRILASVLLPKKWPYLDSRKCARSFEKYLGLFNKVAILTTDPGYRKQSYLFGAENGWWEGNIWYSNTSYLPPVPPKWEAWDTGFINARCDVCQAYGQILSSAQICLACNSCQDCLDDAKDCQCWIKELKRETLQRSES